MRKPRLPREPRAPREEAIPPAGAVPPPGFSVPIKGWSFAPRGGPQPPARLGAGAPLPHGPPPAPSTIAAPPAPPPPPPASGFDAPPAGPAIAAAATNEYAETSATRGYWQARSTRRAQPQGETQLVHAWLHILTVQKIPPHACTIWLTRVEPQPTYDLYIRGEAVISEFPDRSLYDYVNANRRQRDVAERFVGRIKAPANDGSAIELAGGEIYLPPAPVPAAAPAPGPAWSQPGVPGYPYAPPGGYPGAPPWMPPGMPWWMQGGGAPPGMMPPWWGPSAPPPLSALLAAHHPPPAPAAVQQDPAAMRAWEMMSQNQTTLLSSVLELATRQPPPAAAAAAQPDMWGSIERIIAITEKLRGPPAEAEPRVTVINLDEDTRLVTHKDGSIDPVSSAFANMKGLKGVATALGNLRRNPGAAGPGGGPQPPKRNVLAPGAPPAKPNGAPS